MTENSKKIEIGFFSYYKSRPPANPAIATALMLARSALLPQDMNGISVSACGSSQGISAVVPDNQCHQDAPSSTPSHELIAAREVLEGSGIFHEGWIRRLASDETIILADLWILHSRGGPEALEGRTVPVQDRNQVIEVPANLYLNQLEIKYQHTSNTDSYGFLYQPRTPGSTPYIVPSYTNGRCDEQCSVCDAAPNRRFPHDAILENLYRSQYPSLDAVLRWCADGMGCKWGSAYFYDELKKFDAWAATFNATPPPNTAPVANERRSITLDQLFAGSKTSAAPTSYANAVTPSKPNAPKPVVTKSGLTGGGAGSDAGAWTEVKPNKTASHPVPRPAPTATPAPSLFGSDAHEWCRARLGRDFDALKRDHTAQCIKCPGDIHTSRKLYVGHGKPLVSHSLKDSMNPEESDFVRIFIDNLDSNPAPLRDFAELFAAVGTAVIDVYRPTFQDASGKWIFKTNCVVKIPKSWAPPGKSAIDAALVLHILREQKVVYRGKPLRFQFFSR